MTEILTKAIEELTPVQKEATIWGKGPLLVLAGPGSGKTRVLTTRIAYLLEQQKVGRILALTFTTKAADEMKSRVKALTIQDERVSIGTFHSFCVNVLRQHGAHLGINPDFSIYSREDDRKALLKDSLANIGRSDLIGRSDFFLKIVDKLRKRLMGAESATKIITGVENAKTTALIYEVYEQALKNNNILDFDTLIFETCRLFKSYPAIARQYQKTYTHWLLDEFQDTTPAQYFLIKTLASPEFNNIFIVADDDQIIYQWNGASYKQIENFRKDFSPDLLQLPTNFRCPPVIVDLANLLVVNNKSRVSEKQPLKAGKTKLRLPPEEHVCVKSFEDDKSEIEALIIDIDSKAKDPSNSIAVLARTRARLMQINNDLRKAGIPAVIAQRRDDFLTAKFVWLDACIKQAAFPLDQRNLRILVESFNRISGIKIAPESVILTAEGDSMNYVEAWVQIINETKIDQTYKELTHLLVEVTRNNSLFRRFIASALTKIKDGIDMDTDPDLVDDNDAWLSLTREISDSAGGAVQLVEFAQELGMRSKEPPVREGYVSLLTIHAAKGKEFDYVYLIGATEGVLPSYQSVEAGETSVEMEEERRNCFVAITRTKECLMISWPGRERGYARKPSRFLIEMGLVKTEPA